MPQRMREDVRPPTVHDTHPDGERAQAEVGGVERAGERVVAGVHDLEPPVEQEPVDAVGALPTADLVGRVEDDDVASGAREQRRAAEPGEARADDDDIVECGHGDSLAQRVAPASVVEFKDASCVYVRSR